MAGVVVPVARTVFLCREVRPTPSGTDLVGLFDVLFVDRFPADIGPFFAMAQLAGGLGEMAVRFEFRRALDGQVIWATAPAHIPFHDRGRVVQLVTTFPTVRLDRPGVYLAELYCNNHWVGDTTFTVREEQP